MTDRVRMEASTGAHSLRVATGGEVHARGFKDCGGLDRTRA